ncbi:lantibiotic dehydratase [Pedobacter mucosus]|uniref:lantibiotic dehydratase n=1 Tax=Pedobacter mucosus TaxID=2895286 RepID=UPI001EE3F83D|nr:lantibiotic dehydratase [Pedobacter mucosus]UKT63109.1 lantibiotic dehydratase [Pedobacter mucosus]
MKIKFDPTVIFRTPKFSYHSDLAASWEELKKSIAISSDAFYQTIKEIKADDLQSLPPKIFFTIWKYFNRAKFRSTPYGTFASFSILENAFKNEDANITINEEQLVNEFIDWPVKNDIQVPFFDLLEKNLYLFSNSSYYLIAGNIRYIACTDGLFELAEIENSDLIIRILVACLKPIKFYDLLEKLQLNNEDKESIYNLLEDMHAIQLVFTDFDPNIIGEDYFQRLEIKSDDNIPKYIIAKRKVKAGTLNENLFSAVPNLISLLQSVLPVNEPEALRNFKDKFIKKFEQQEVALLTVMDPEIGIGYDELEHAGQNVDFISKLNNRKTKESIVNNLQSVLSSVLIPQKFEDNKTIFLDKLALKRNDTEVKLPNTFSLLLSISDDLLCVNQIGGATANALSGRFSLADITVEKNCKKVAEIEQLANPDILFFDVAYMVETNIDNINRRKLVYSHQLSILNFDTSNDPLTLNDIMVSIAGNTVILRSKKHNKRIIPKIASAYNYSRSDLAVFRLLCDLQNQDLQVNLSISLDQIFPDLNYYPRLQYKNIVLSMSKWQVTKREIFINGNPTIEYCRSYLIEKGVSKCFKTGVSDQTLCFFINSDEDLSAFILFMQKQDSIYLEEVILPINSCVKDENLAPYNAQFIFNLNHGNQIYEGLKGQYNEPSNLVTKNFLPGNDWLYFEIYCHQQRSDQILIEVITAFILEYREKIKLWFFIRYNENGNHIRFRVLLHNKEDGQILTSAFSNYLKDKLLNGLVSDLQIKIYKREIDRYGEDLIEKIEEHFYMDSNFVLSMLETQPDHFCKYKVCASLMFNVQHSEIISKEESLKLIRLMSDSFNEEHQLDAADFKQLNVQYQLYRKVNNCELNTDQLSKFEQMNRSLLTILRDCLPNRRLKLLSDLIHMHVNRLFDKDQRTHEMVMYYFLLKDIQRLNALGH